MRNEATKLLELALAGSTQADEATVRYLMRSLRRWLIGGRDGPPLSAVLGLPSSAERARTGLRDAYLRCAAEILAPSFTGQKWALACALHAELRAFAGHQWLCWAGDEDGPPPHASEVQSALWWAMRASPNAHRLTAQRLMQIIDPVKAF